MCAPNESPEQIESLEGSLGEGSERSLRLGPSVHRDSMGVGTAGARVVVYGAGGHARVVADLLASSGLNLMGYIDERKPVGLKVGAHKVLGSGSWLAGAPGVLVALGIGDNRIRQEVFDIAVRAGSNCPPFVHPRATVSPSANLEVGVVVMAGAIVNANASVGAGAIINSGAVVEHDCVVGRFAHVSPNATLAGAAKIGAFAHVGATACVLPGIEVGEAAIVGAGAVVVRTAQARVVLVGVPARVLRELP